MKSLWGDDEVARILSNPLVAEDVGRVASKASMAEIESALEDASNAGAARWPWLAQRLRNPRPGLSTDGGGTPPTR